MEKKTQPPKEPGKGGKPMPMNTTPKAGTAKPAYRKTNWDSAANGGWETPNKARPAAGKGWPKAGG